MKNERGSISLFVLLSALFFLVVVTSVGVSFKNKETRIDTEFAKIKASYEKDIGNEEQIYMEKTNSDYLSEEDVNSIIDYDVDLGIDVDGNSQYDWQYFYNDGNNIYIIAEDYIPMNSSLLSNSLGNEKESINIQPYSFFYPMPDGDESIINNGKTGSDELFGNNVSASNKFIPDKFLISWKNRVQNSPTTANNAKFVAMMMDTAKWENFADSTKIKTTLGTSKPEELLATGGPTIEMWVKSWNKKHGNSSNDENKIEIEYDCSENGIGYGVRSEGGEWDDSIDLSNNSEGIEDIMYLPHNSSYNGCDGYWIISPSVQGYNSMMRIGYNGTITGDGCGNWCFGLRPVVCLPSDITAEWSREENIWKIKKKEENVEFLTDNDYLIVMDSSKFEGKNNVGTIQDFRDLVNSGTFDYTTAYLYEDIELGGSESNEWEPIGTENNNFTAVFDGRNHKIEGLYIDEDTQGQGLFRGNAGTIKNLTVSGEIKGSAVGVGGIVAQNDKIIENCTSNVTITGAEYLGGIVGYNTSSGTITNCRSNNNIKGTQIVGGIVGGTDGSITGCTNSGKIESTSSVSSTISTGTMGTGGIAGIVYDNTVTNCRNLNEVKSVSNCTGGIVGTNISSTVKGCYNDGDITDGAGGIGGIVGFQKGSNPSPSTSYCYNKKSVYGASNLGGIVGDLSAGNVENCYNIGQVTAGVSWTVYNKGGICGRSLSGTNVKNCYTLNSLDLDVVGIPEENTVDSLSKKETEANMKSAEFVTTLNSTEINFGKVDGYPILNWQ